jgi:hypothetical protein
MRTGPNNKEKKDVRVSSSLLFSVIGVSIIAMLVITPSLSLTADGQSAIDRILVQAQERDQTEEDEADEEERDEEEEDNNEGAEGVGEVTTTVTAIPSEPITTTTPPPPAPTTVANANSTAGVGPQTYQGVNRAEVITDNGNVLNPGGAGNQAIDLAGEEAMSRPSNLADIVLPQSTQIQEYEDLKIALQASGYAISDMQYTLSYRTNVPVVVVRGIEGMSSQPNTMMLEQIAASYGYTILSHMYVGNAWETIFTSAVSATAAGPP